MLSTIEAKIISWWNYSRTIFLNALVALSAIAGELLSFAVGFDWSSIIKNPRAAAGILLAVNVMNIILRFITTKPVGQKDV